jgi:enoyl-CoA hydratase/carnithine racemase
VSPRLRITQQEEILLFTLEGDDGFPRLERRILSEIKTRIANVAESRELAGAVITGTERAFSTGAEITELVELTPSEAFEFARYGQSVMQAIDGSPKPVVAAIRGYCMGGGLDLALACHARIAPPDSVFAHPGGSLGIITGWGGTQRLPRLIGRARALEILVTGLQLSGNEAHEWGLVTRITPANAVVSEAIREVRTMASRSRSSRE